MDFSRELMQKVRTISMQLLGPIALVWLAFGSFYGASPRQGGQAARRNVVLHAVGVLALLLASAGFIRGASPALGLITALSYASLIFTLGVLLAPLSRLAFRASLAFAAVCALGAPLL